MGTLLIVIGGIWALIGGGNLVGMPWTSGASGILTMGLMFNMLVFVFPGLILVGLGSRMRSKNREKGDHNPDPITQTDLSDERECPFCAELIKAKAVKCKHCGSEVEPFKKEEQKQLKTIATKTTEIDQVTENTPKYNSAARIDGAIKREYRTFGPRECIFIMAALGVGSVVFLAFTLNSNGFDWFK